MSAIPVKKALPHHHILAKLLSAPDQFISGSQIAQELNISRVSVWNYIQSLEAQGFQFLSSTNRGYKIQSLPSLQFSPDLIRARLSLANHDIPFIFLPSTDSTNTQAFNLLQSNQCPTPFALAAAQQSAGRGRQNRSWFSPNSGNLYLTLAFNTSLPLNSIPSFTPFAAVSLAHSLSSYTNLHIQVKWPNDLLINGKKIAGMLAESKNDIDRTTYFIFGLGLNINSSTSSLPPELQSTASSLLQEANHAFDLNEITPLIISTLLSAFHTFSLNQHSPIIHSLWPQYDFLKNKTIHFSQNGSSYQATPLSLNPDGSLLVKLPNNSTLSINAGEVHLSPQP